MGGLLVFLLISFVLKYFRVEGSFYMLELTSARMITGRMFLEFYNAAFLQGLFFLDIILE